MLNRRAGFSKKKKSKRSQHDMAVRGGQEKQKMKFTLPIVSIVQHATHSIVERADQGNGQGQPCQPGQPASQPLVEHCRAISWVLTSTNTVTGIIPIIQSDPSRALVSALITNE